MRRIAAKFVPRLLTDDQKQHWVLHQDKATAHTSLSVQQFLAFKNMTVIPHPLTRL
jgi:hypothetical protein